MTTRDFADYTVTETAPLTCSYRGYAIVSAPPPSSAGNELCEILNILEGYDIATAGFRSAPSVRWMVEAMRRAYFDRNTRLGDPVFVANPLEQLLSKDYAAAVRGEIERRTGACRRPFGSRAERKGRNDALFGRRWRG